MGRWAFVVCWLAEGLGESGSPVAFLELIHHHLTADASSNGPTLILHDLQYHLQLDPIPVMPSSHHLGILLATGPPEMVAVKR